MTISLQNIEMHFNLFGFYSYFVHKVVSGVLTAENCNNQITNDCSEYYVLVNAVCKWYLSSQLCMYMFYSVLYF